MNLGKILEDFKNKNYYEVLGVDTDINTASLRRARRNLLTEYHPDKFEGVAKAFCEEICSVINLAYEALSDESFVSKYIDSGMKLKYKDHSSVPDESSLKNMVKMERKGMTMTAIATLTAAELRKGGKIKVNPLPLPGKEEEVIERTIQYPPNTKVDSMLIFDGLGEELKDGLNGDLIVHFSANKKLNDFEVLRGMITSGTSFVDLSSVTNPIGLTELDVSKLVDEKCKLEVFKENEAGHILFIKSNKSLSQNLLIYY